MLIIEKNVGRLDLYKEEAHTTIRMKEA